MTDRENKLAAKMLKLAAEAFGRHGCNDVPDSVYEGWTLDERKAFNKAFHEWNGDPEEYMEDYLHLPDFALMDYLAHRLEQETN